MFSMARLESMVGGNGSDVLIDAEGDALGHASAIASKGKLAEGIGFIS
jgi:hypothetical protein